MVFGATYASIKVKVVLWDQRGSERTSKEVINN